MTVQELIDKLSRVKDKSIPVKSVEMTGNGEAIKEFVEIVGVFKENNKEYLWISTNLYL